MKNLIIFLLLLPLLTINPFKIGIENNSDNIRINDEIHNQLFKKLYEIANELIKSHEIDSTGNYKWKKVLNVQNSPLISDQYFPGLFSGASGIGYFFLKMYEYTKNVTYLTVAEKSANYVFSQKKYLNDSIYWTRSEYSLSDSYTSQKSKKKTGDEADKAAA